MNIKDSRILTIKQIYPDVININKPCIQGNVHDIYIATTNKNKFVCRFSDERMAKHNCQVSQLLTQHNIPVPRVTIYRCGMEYCETYPFVEGKTLHERLIEGMPSEKVVRAYLQILDLSREISKIPFESVTKTKISITTKICAKFFSILNYSNIALCHTDLHAKNVILDNNDNIKAILDLDGVYPEHTVVPLINTVANAKSYNYDIQNLTDICHNNNIKQKFIQIETQTKIYSAIKTAAKKILGDFMVKQLLKVRVK